MVVGCVWFVGSVLVCRFVALPATVAVAVVVAVVALAGAVGVAVAVVAVAVAFSGNPAHVIRFGSLGNR